MTTVVIPTDNIEVVTVAVPGADGQGLPIGGTAGQVPFKVDDVNYNVEWGNLTGGGDMLRANNLSDLASSTTALTNLGFIATIAELNYMGGVTSAVQTQLDGKATVSHTHVAADITSGTFADARVAESNVTQHEAALSITEGQISDLGSYLDSADIGVSVQAYDADTAKTDVAQEYTKAQNFNATTLTDAASIVWNLEDNQVASVTLAGNRTLAAPSNMKDGGTYILIVKQDAVGSRALTFNAAYKFSGGTAPTLSPAVNAVDIITFVSDGTSLFGVAQLDFS